MKINHNGRITTGAFAREPAMNIGGGVILHITATAA